MFEAALLERCDEFGSRTFRGDCRQAEGEIAGSFLLESWEYGQAPRRIAALPPIMNEAGLVGAVGTWGITEESATRRF